MRDAIERIEEVIEDMRYRRIEDSDIVVVENMLQEIKDLQELVKEMRRTILSMVPKQI